MQQTVIIKQAQKEDLPAILALQYLAYQSEALLLNNFSIPPLKEPLGKLEEQLSTGLFLKAVDSEGIIIGSVRGQESEYSLFVGKLMVHPEKQGQGLGTRLLLDLENYSSKTRFELFTSDKSIKNIKFYEKNGYKVFKKQKAAPGFHFIYMEKKLPKK